MQLYIRHLFYNALTRNSSDRVLKLVRKLHWEDPAVSSARLEAIVFLLGERHRALKTLRLTRSLRMQIVRKLHSAFTKVWKIKYSNVHLFAVLLYDLGRYHPEFSVAVIDEVLENIRVGMEVRGLLSATVKLCPAFEGGEKKSRAVRKLMHRLSPYRSAASSTISSAWRLSSISASCTTTVSSTRASSSTPFGRSSRSDIVRRPSLTFLDVPSTSNDPHSTASIAAEGRPYPDVPSPIDPVDDCFRVRLVCTLLDTCGSCFERGALKKKLDSFLTFFQVCFSRFLRSALVSRVVESPS